jgi:hypothetical protein
MVDDDPALMQSLMPKATRAARAGGRVPDRGVGHQLPAAHSAKFDAADVAAALAARDERITELEAELAAPKGQPRGRSLGRDGLLQRLPGEFGQ